MADIAHTKTDQKLEEMEKRLSAIYSRAEKEIGKRWKEYLAESQEEIDELQKAYDLAKKGGDAKEIKKAGIALSRAKKDRTLMDSRFKALTETTAAQLANVNKTAIAYINGELPEVYSINYNALEPSVDGVGGYSFALVDADTVKNLATTDKSLLPFKELDEKKDIRWNVKKMNAEVLQGILQGEPMDKIAGRLSKVADMNETAAIRNARTMVTGAENKGRQDSYARATADGIILQKEWISTNDSRTRHSHAALDGATVDQDKKFDNGLMYPGDPNGRPEEVYNCFIGETKVASDSDVVRSYKHKYNGKIISVKTAGGVQFSCTPNHPILTPCGWVAAELLNNGDNILVTNGENNVFARVNPYIKHRFPRIDAIHKFGKKFGGERACGLSVNFHGDISTADVEVVTHKRLLRNGRDSGGGNCINKFLFKLSNKTLSCFGSLFEHFRSVCKTSFGFVGRKCKSLSFFKCSVSHSCEHGFGTVTNRNIILTEYSINDLPADTVIDGELLDRLSSKVFLDTIVSVDVSVLSTHVYNLQTENGYYFVNSIVPQDAEKSNGIFAIAKNCRCTVAAVVKGFKKAQVQNAMEGYGTALNGDKYAMNPKDINGVTRGEAMSFEDADGKAGNPKYRKGTGTAQNCQSCVVANEARRRGYNVSAQSYTKNKTAEMLSQNPRIAWVDPKTGDVPDFVPWDYKRTYDKNSYRAFLDENVKAGERYTLQFNWLNASGGHIISAERDSRGALRLYDPQTGKIYDKDWSLNDLMGRMSYTDRSGRSDPPKLLRVDNLAFREDVTKNILEEGAKVWTPTDDQDDWIPF